MPFTSFTQPYVQWIKTDTINATDSRYIRDLDFDTVSNLYFTFRGSDYSVPMQLDNTTLNNIDDIIVGKIKKDSIKCEWLKTINAFNYWLSVNGKDIVACPSGLTYTLSEHFDQIVIDFAGEVYNFSNCYKRGIYAHSKTGEELWCMHLPAYFNSIAAHSNGDFILSGNYSMGFLFDTIPIQVFGGLDCIVAKYDSTGQFKWVQSFGGSEYDEIHSMAYDQEGNILCTGYYTSNDFVLGNTTLPPTTDKRAFVVKLAPDGTYLWHYCLGPGISIGRNICTNQNNEVIFTGAQLTPLVQNGNAYLTNPGSQARFVIKLSESGSCIWAKNFYTNCEFNQYHSMRLCDIEAGPDNTIFFGGWYRQDLYHQGDTLRYQIVQPGYEYKEPFLIKLNDDGQMEWFECFHTEDPSQNEMHGISVAPDGSIACAISYTSADSLTIIDTTLYPLTPTHDPFYIVILGDKDSHALGLRQGWSYISTYIKPDQQDMAELFAPVVQNLKIIKNDVGMVYWPQFGLNLIGNYIKTEGYQICMDQADTLHIKGYRIRPWETPLALDSAWQIIPYLRRSAAPLTDMLSPIDQHINIIKNSNGLVYWPYWNLNAIGNMKPGEGYMLNCLAPCTLVYPK